MVGYWYLALAGVALALGSTAILLLWLWRRVSRLERQFQEYHQALTRLGSDLTEFRTLSAQAEEQLDEVVSKLERLGAWLKEREELASGEEPVYQAAVERIRRGADVEELVESLHLSREEAALLIRMHSLRLGGRHHWES